MSRPRSTDRRNAILSAATRVTRRGHQRRVRLSAVEDGDRKIAVLAGFRGSRYISAEVSARDEWLPGGSKNAGADAYARSNQGNLATVFAFAREYPRLRFNAIEPGVIPA